MKKIVYLLFGLLLFQSNISMAQWTTNGLTSAFFGDYLGGNLASTTDLDIKMRANFNMKFFTNDLQRMTIMTNLLLAQVLCGGLAWLTCAYALLRNI